MIETLSALILSSLIAGSCSRSNSGSPVSLPAITEVTCDSIVTPPVLLSVTRLFTIKDQMVAYQERNDTLFSFWKLPECQLLYSAGIRGEGPDEFLMLERNFQETTQGFRTFELQTNRIKDVRITEEGNLNVISDYQLPTNLSPLNRFLFLADSTYCFVSTDDAYEFTLLKKDGTTHNFGAYPTHLLKEDTDTPNRFVYNKLTVAHPSGDKFAAFYAYTGLVRIYSYTGELLKETLLPTKETTEKDEKTIYYHLFPYATDQYIYILNQQEDIQTLEKWNWEGELISRYALNHPVSSFVIDKEEKRMYAVSKEREDCIYIYQIN